MEFEKRRVLVASNLGQVWLTLNNDIWTGEIDGKKYKIKSINLFKAEPDRFSVELEEGNAPIIE